MCDDTIISPDTIRACARRAHAAGKGRDDHHMNFGSAAITDWQEEWDRCERSRETGNHVTDASNKLGQQLEAA